MRFRFTLINLVLLSSLLLSLQRVEKSNPNIKNFHSVDDQVCRSGQPNRKDMVEAQIWGVKTILNLRNVIDDDREIKGTSLVQVRLPRRAKNISYQDIVDALCAIETAEKPVLIHCLHGSDRTGCIVAAYRMTHGWTKEQAISEFKEPKYGYNKNLFPNILELLLSIDVEELKKDVNCNN